MKEPLYVFEKSKAKKMVSIIYVGILLIVAPLIVGGLLHLGGVSSIWWYVLILAVLIIGLMMMAAIARSRIEINDDDLTLVKLLNTKVIAYKDILGVNYICLSNRGRSGGTTTRSKSHHFLLVYDNEMTKTFLEAGEKDVSELSANFKVAGVHLADQVSLDY